MHRRIKHPLRKKAVAIVTTLLLAVAMAALPFRRSKAMITGGEGNQPIHDPGWPAGTAAIFNHTGRVAYWVGPPFGGGEWHAECRSDAKALNAVLADFVKLDVKTKKIVVHDGPGTSVWLNINREKDKMEAAKMDWSFSVWQPASWEQLRKMPDEFVGETLKAGANGPPSTIDIYTSDHLLWADLVIPQGMTIDDQRMAAHGFSPADGNVLEGNVIDLATQKPIAAKVRLQSIETPKTGGYKYPVVSGTVADTQGHWVLTNAPAGWYRVVLEADGYVSRVAGHARFDAPARWQSFNSGLLPPAPVSGRVIDAAGQPLADVDVRFGDVAPEAGGQYGAPDEFNAKTDADGRFHTDLIPGHASVWVRKDGYVRPGLGPKITAPNADIALTMTKSTRLAVSIDFKGAAPIKGYMIDLEPEGGNVVGSWGGSATVNEKGQYAFENVPPGKYILVGHPNPGGDRDKTDPVTVELKGGEIKEVTLTAKPVAPPPGANPPAKPVKPPTTDERF